MSESRGKQSWGKRKQGGDGNSFGNKKVKKDFKKGGYKGKKENEKPRLFGKELKEFRRSTKPHAELIADLNKQWQKLTNADRKDKKDQVQQMLTDSENRLFNAAKKKDGSRVIQAMIKHAAADQREQIYKELSGNVIDLSQSKFGHHVVLQLLQYGPQLHTRVLKEFSGQVRKQSCHAEASKILDFLFASGKDAVKHKLMREFYGREFALFYENDKIKGEKLEDALTNLLEKYKDKKDTIITELDHQFNKFIDKEMMMFRYFHTLAFQYLHALPEMFMEKFFEKLCSAVLNLYHSEHGLYVLCHLLGHGSVKQRKKLVAATKGNVLTIIQNPCGYVYICKLLDTVDDTALTTKAILVELEPKISELLDDPSAVRALCFLFAEDKKDIRSLIPQKLAGLLEPTMKDGQPTSKKPREVRRSQLLETLLSTTVKAVTEKTSEMIKDKAGVFLFYQMLREAHVRASDGSIKGMTELSAGIQASIIDLMKEENADEHILQDLSGHYLIKRIIVNLKPNSHEFCTSMYDAIPTDTLMELAKTNRGGFVLTSLLEHADKALVKKVAKQLKTDIDELKKCERPGNKVLVKTLEGLKKKK